jgi:hypothetical protein
VALLFLTSASVVVLVGAWHVRDPTLPTTTTISFLLIASLAATQLSVFRTLLDIVSGMQYLHSLGLVHGELAVLHDPAGALTLQLRRMLRVRVFAGLQAT